MAAQKIGYVRVSTTEQNTDRQLTDVQLDKVYTEKLSGKDIKRPELQKMLENLREGDAVYVHSLDRLARNLKDLIVLVGLIKDKGCSIHFVKENLSFSAEKSDAMSNLILSVFGAVYEFERSLIKERQREGIAVAVANGKFKNCGRKSALTERQIVEIRKLYSDRVSVASLARLYDVSRQTIYNALDDCRKDSVSSLEEIMGMKPETMKDLNG